MKFKRNLYITAPVNQTGLVPGLQAEGAKSVCMRACVRVCLCVHWCPCVAKPEKGVGGLILVGGVEGSKRPGMVQCRMDCSSAYLPFCQLINLVV